MSRVFLRASCIVCMQFGVVFSSEEPVISDAVLDTVYSDFLPASETNPDYSVATVTVLSPKDFAASDLTVADVIEQSPSVQIQNTGELGSYASVSVRGAPSQQTQIYIDGILQSGVGGEGGYLQHIPLTDVERIEVYASSLPMQFSQGSPGGAVNIVRKKAATSRLHLVTDVGSFGRKHLSAAAEGVLNSWSISGFIEHLNTNNNFSYINENGTPLYDGDDSEQRRNNAEYLSTQASLKVNRQWEAAQVNMGLDGFDSKKNLPHWNNFDAVDTFYAQKGLTGTAGFNLNGWAKGIDSSLQWQSSELSGHFSDPNNLIGIFSNDSKDTLRAHQLLHHTLFNTSFGLIGFNNELHSDQFKLSDELIGTTLNAQRHSASTSLGAELFLNNDIVLAGTGRHLWYQDTATGNKQSNQAVGFQLGARADRNEATFQINLQSSARQPSLVERFGNLGTFAGNDALESEQAHSIDASLTTEQNKKSISANIYYRYALNAIAPVYNAQGIGRYINLDSAHYLGVEWQATLASGSYKYLNSGAWQEGVSLSPLDVYNRKRVPGFYPISMNQTIEWQAREAMRVRLNYTFESGLFYDRANSTQAPTKHRVDASVSYELKPFKASFDVKNIFNQIHLDFSSMPLPRQSYVLTLEYTLGNNE